MIRTKLLASALAATATIAGGAFAAAPPASARPPRGDCASLALQSANAQLQGDLTWQQKRRAAAYAYWGLASAYARAAEDCGRGR